MVKNNIDYDYKEVRIKSIIHKDFNILELKDSISNLLYIDYQLYIKNIFNYDQVRLYPSLREQYLLAIKYWEERFDLFDITNFMLFLKEINNFFLLDNQEKNKDFNSFLAKYKKCSKDSLYDDDKHKKHKEKLDNIKESKIKIQGKNTNSSLFNFPYMITNSLPEDSLIKEKIPNINIEEISINSNQENIDQDNTTFLLDMSIGEEFFLCNSSSRIRTYSDLIYHQSNYHLIEIYRFVLDFIRKRESLDDFSLQKTIICKNSIFENNSKDTNDLGDFKFFFNNPSSVYLESYDLILKKIKTRFPNARLFFKKQEKSIIEAVLIFIYFEA